MKISLSLVGLIAVASGMSSLVACSSEPPVPLPSGGTTGSGGAAGTGGDTSTGGAAPTNLIFNGSTAWVPGDMNAVGIQGSFFILEDSVKDAMPIPADGLMHTDFTADSGGSEDPVSSFTDATLMPCISGNAVQVTDETGATGCNAAGPETDPGACQWSLQWGGGIGLNLNETGGENSTQGVWNALTANNGGPVTGFTFLVSGEAGGATLRFKAKNEGSDEDFCKAFTIVPDTPVTIALSELVHQCWGTAGTQVLNLENISQLQWQVVTDAAASHTVANLCIQSLSWY